MKKHFIRIILVGWIIVSIRPTANVASHDTDMQRRQLADSSSVELVRLTEILHETPFDVAVKPDSSEIAVATQTGVQRFALPSLDYIDHVFEQIMGIPYYVVWSPDGTQVAVAGYAYRERGIEIWDVASHTLVRQLTPNDPFREILQWSPNGQYIAVNGGFFWNLETGDLMIDLAQYAERMYQVAWSPDGEQLAVITQDTMVIWDVITNAFVDEVSMEVAGNGGIDWSTNGVVVSTVEGLMVWQEDSGIGWIGEQRQFDSRAVAWSPDGNRVATIVSEDDGQAGRWNLYVIDTNTNEVLHIIEEGIRRDSQIDWLGNSEQLVISHEQLTPTLWDITTETKIAQADGFYGGYLAGYGDTTSVSLSPDGQQVAVATSAQRVEVWNINEKVIGYTVEGETVEWSPDREWLATISEMNLIKIWDAENGNLQQTIETTEDWTFRVEWSPDSGLLASNGIDPVVRVWNPQTGELVREIDTLQGLIAPTLLDRETGVAWSPDGRRLATVMGTFRVRIWDVESGELIEEAQRPLVQGAGQGENVEWSDDGNRLAFDGWDERPVVKVLDMTTNETVQFENTTYGQNRFVWLIGNQFLVNANGSLAVFNTNSESIHEQVGESGENFVAVSRSVMGDRIVAITDWKLVIFDVVVSE